MTKKEKLQSLTYPLSYSDNFAIFVDSLPENYRVLFETETNIVDQISYLDVASEDNTKISYLSFNKLIASNNILLYYDTLQLKSFAEVSDDEGTFCGSLVQNAYNPFNRIMAKPGKVFKMLFPTLNDKDVEYLSSKYKTFVLQYFSTDNLEANFKLVKGHDIAFYYREENYSDKGSAGDLHSSCMKNVSSELFKLYTQNSQVQLAVLFDDEEKVKARSLVWDNTYFDRVYGVTYDSELELKAILSKSYTDIWKGRSYYPAHSKDKITIKLDKSNFDSYPFLDSLYLLNTDTNYIGNCLSIKPTCCLDGTEGNVTKLGEDPGYHVQSIDELMEYFQSYYYCDDCGCSTSDLYRTYEGNNVCEDCLVTCDYSYVRSTGRYMYTTYDGNLVHSSAAMRISDHRFAWEGDDTLVFIDGVKYPADEVGKSDIDEEYYLKTELDTYSVDGTMYYCTYSQYETLEEEHEQAIQ